MRRLTQTRSEGESNNNKHNRNSAIFYFISSSFASTRSWTNGSLATTKDARSPSLLLLAQFLLCTLLRCCGPQSVWLYRGKKIIYVWLFPRNRPRFALGHSGLKWLRVARIQCQKCGLPFSLYTEVPTWKFSGMLNVLKSPVPGMKYGGRFTLPSPLIDSKVNKKAIRKCCSGAFMAGKRFWMFLTSLRSVLWAHFELKVAKVTKLLLLLLFIAERTKRVTNSSAKHFYHLKTTRRNWAKKGCKR